MDTLEVSKHAGLSPKPLLGHVPPLKQPIFRIKIGPNLPCHWDGFHRITVFFLADDVAVKLQNQFPVAELDTTLDQLLFEFSLYSFHAEELAKDTLSRLQGSPCKNLGFVFDMGIDGPLFSERLTPLTATVWAAATKDRRRRWAVELASAFAHLEMLGLMPLKTHAGDIGVDRTGRLKLVGYETSPRRIDDEEPWDGYGLHPTARHQLAAELAHQSLACCLYYVLSGVDIDSEILCRTSAESRETFRKILLRGDYPLDDPDACVVSDIIRDAWAKRPGDTSFAWIAEAVRAALEGLGIEQESELPPALTDSHYDSLRTKCRGWADAQVLDPRWMEYAEYKAECDEVDYPV